MAIQLDKEVERTIREHANRVYPEECAGALFSKLDSDERVIIESMELDNSDNEENRKRNFEISPADYMKAEKYADENNMVLAGIYHSHPDNPAVPSQKDLMKAMPVFSYVIISVKNGEQAELRSWIINKQGLFEEETVESVEERQPNV
jgi:proteasome lid subunit RPN8/RPN11